MNKRFRVNWFSQSRHTKRRRQARRAAGQPGFAPMAWKRKWFRGQNSSELNRAVIYRFHSSWKWWSSLSFLLLHSVICCHGRWVGSMYSPNVHADLHVNPDTLQQRCSHPIAKHYRLLSDGVFSHHLVHLTVHNWQFFLWILNAHLSSLLHKYETRVCIRPLIYHVERALIQRDLEADK